jgi:signal transduction histidine kinase
MLTLESTKERLQVDWLISNLRWLLLISVALASVADLLVSRHEPLDPALLMPQVVLLTIAALYNLLVMIALSSFAVEPRLVPLGTLAVDTLLTIGFVTISGGLDSSLLFFALFPILTAALRFRWTVSVFAALSIVGGCGLLGYLTANPSTLASSLASFGGRALVLLLATLISALVGGQVKQVLLQARRLEEENELKKLKAAREHSRAIFELATALSATLNYDRVLEAVLEVSAQGMRDLGDLVPNQVGLVTLFGRDHLRIVASRHVPEHDLQVTLTGKTGVLAKAFKSSEPVIIENPARDPELGQISAMSNCRQAIVVPLQAGFEDFGALIFAGSAQRTYTPDHQQLLHAICSQAIVALQNAQLYQTLMEEKERIVAVEEDARKKLSRDLHDGPTQSIAAIAMQVNYARTLLKDSPVAARAELERTEDLARRTTKEIRHMLFTLRPLILETQGLQAALAQYIAKLAETDKVRLHLQADEGVDRTLSQQAQGIVFYILEEAVGNARKHSRATNIWVRLATEGDHFVAQVEDDGISFDVDTVLSAYDESDSLGLMTMRERSELVGGDLSIESSQGEGTRVTLKVPLKGERIR